MIKQIQKQARLNAAVPWLMWWLQQRISLSELKMLSEWKSISLYEETQEDKSGSKIRQVSDTSQIEDTYWQVSVEFELEE
jgi:hypothetical protein